MDVLNLRSSTQVAALLRNPEEDYPSSGLVRTYLKCLADPSDKFTLLLRARRGEIEEQLSTGVQALQIADRYSAVYRVAPKTHLITILDGDELAQADLVYPDPVALADTVSASLAVPSHWVQICRICGKPFIARSACSQVCYRRDDVGRMACRREAARLYRKARKLALAQNAPQPARALIAGLRSWDID